MRGLQALMGVFKEDSFYRHSPGSLMQLVWILDRQNPRNRLSGL